VLWSAFNVGGTNDKTVSNTLDWKVNTVVDFVYVFGDKAIEFGDSYLIELVIF